MERDDGAPDQTVARSIRRDAQAHLPRASARVRVGADIDRRVAVARRERDGRIVLGEVLVRCRLQ